MVTGYRAPVEHSAWYRNANGRIDDRPRWIDLARGTSLVVQKRLPIHTLPDRALLAMLVPSTGANVTAISAYGLTAAMR